jgi:uncharacterized integral membrane protein
MLIFATLAVIFIAQNVAVVEIGFLYWKAYLPSGLLIFVTVMIGFMLGWFLHEYLLYRKAKNEIYLR